MPGWPADGYRGDYIDDVAQAYLRGDTTVVFEDHVMVGAKDPADLDAIRRFAVATCGNEQTGDLAAFGVGFDVYFLESSLYDDGKVEETVARTDRARAYLRGRRRAVAAQHRLRRRTRTA